MTITNIPRAQVIWIGFPSFPPTKKTASRSGGTWWPPGCSRPSPKAELPKLRGGIWHPYRRLWASERKSMPDVDVAAAGGWKDTRALKLSYQQADPASILRVVEGGGGG